MLNTTSPFAFLESVAARFQPPAWVVDEAQQRLVLFLNHVLMQEKEAQTRLARKQGSVVHVRWGLFAIDLVVTPAGLVDRAVPLSKPDLLVTVTAASPLLVLQAVFAGKPPPVNIEGDVQFAAELAWLAENLRWDIEEDLSRVLGDIPAHALGDAGRRIFAALKSFSGRGAADTSPGMAAASASAPFVPAAATASTGTDAHAAGSGSGKAPA